MIKTCVCTWKTKHQPSPPRHIAYGGNSSVCASARAMPNYSVCSRAHEKIMISCFSSLSHLTLGGGGDRVHLCIISCSSVYQNTTHSCWTLRVRSILRCETLGKCMKRKKYSCQKKKKKKKTWKMCVVVAAAGVCVRSNTHKCNTVSRACKSKHLF